MTVVENLSAMQETLSSIPGLGRDPLEKGMATHSSILAWRIPWREMQCWTQLRDYILSDLLSKSAKETQMYRTVFWTWWEKVRVGWFERIALKHIYYHMWNRSPAQVRCMRQGAQGCCTGMTLEDGMGREVGGGFRMGNTCIPMTDSCQCMAKNTTLL